MEDRRRARELAAEFIQKGDPIGWFEALYREAEQGKSTVPWVDYHPTPPLVGFWILHPQQTVGNPHWSSVAGLETTWDNSLPRVFALPLSTFRKLPFAFAENDSRIPPSTTTRPICRILLPIGAGCPRCRFHTWAFDFAFPSFAASTHPVSLRVKVLRGRRLDALNRCYAPL